MPKTLPILAGDHTVTLSIRTQFLIILSISHATHHCSFMALSASSSGVS